MITIQDLYNIVGNKIANEAQKALIRNNFPPQIAEQMCNASMIQSLRDSRFGALIPKQADLERFVCGNLHRSRWYS